MSDTYTVGGVKIKYSIGTSESGGIELHKTLKEAKEAAKSLANDFNEDVLVWELDRNGNVIETVANFCPH